MRGGGSIWDRHPASDSTVTAGASHAVTVESGGFRMAPPMVRNHRIDGSRPSPSTSSSWIWIRLARYGGIHPLLPQHRREASSLPTRADPEQKAARWPVLPRLPASGAARAPGFRVTALPRYSTQPMREVRYMPTGNGAMVCDGYIVAHTAVMYRVTLFRWFVTLR